jgi:ribose transport system permease protein
MPEGSQTPVKLTSAPGAGRVTPSSAQRPAGDPVGHWSRFGRFDTLSLLLLLVALWVALSLTTDSFLKADNISNLLRQASLWAIIAIGQTFVMITAGIDLSVGAVVGLASVVVSMLLHAGAPIWLAVVLTLVVGVAVGIANGVCVTALRLPPFITTLASMTALRGFTLLITHGQPIGGLPPSFTGFSRLSFLGVPSLFWSVIIVAVPSYLLLRRSRWGRYIYAVGSNAESVRLSGISTATVIYLVYVVSAVCAAVAGVLVTTRLSLGMAVTGEGWELQSVAAAVIGGASLFGAVGNVSGPVIGALLLTTIAQGGDLLNIDPFWHQIITGLLILAIVFFDQLRRGTSR